MHILPDIPLEDAHLTDTRWDSVDRILDAVLDAPASEREQLLDRECGTDAELRREVESLLAACDDAGSFLEKPASEVASKLLDADRGRASKRTALALLVAGAIAVVAVSSLLFINRGQPRTESGGLRDELNAQNIRRLSSLHEAGVTATKARRFDEAEKALREAVAGRRMLFGSAALPLAESQAELGSLLHQIDRNAEAESVLLEAVSIYSSKGDSISRPFADAAMALSLALTSRGKFDQARGFGEKAKSAYVNLRDPARISAANQNLARISEMLAQRNAAEAKESERYKPANER